MEVRPISNSMMPQEKEQLGAMKKPAVEDKLEMKTALPEQLPAAMPPAGEQKLAAPGAEEMPGKRTLGVA